MLLGDPHTVILDEPANGLDPEGVRWIRDVLVALAREGRTILVSSHLLSEISLMADDLVVIGRGQLIDQGPVEHFIDRYAQRWVRVRTPHPAQFAEVLRRAGAQFRPHGQDGIDVQGLPIERIGEIALQTQTAAVRAVTAERVAGGCVPVGDRRRAGVPHPAAVTHAADPPARPPPPPGRPPGGRPMIDAIRSEWIKLSTLTVNKVLVIIAVVFPVTVVVAGRRIDERLLRLRATSPTSSVASPGCRCCSSGCVHDRHVGRVRLQHDPADVRGPAATDQDAARQGSPCTFVTIAVLMSAIVAVCWVVATGLLDGTFSLTDESSARRRWRIRADGDSRAPSPSPSASESARIRRSAT